MYIVFGCLAAGLLKVNLIKLWSDRCLLLDSICMSDMLMLAKIADSSPSVILDLRVVTWLNPV